LEIKKKTKVEEESINIPKYFFKHNFYLFIKDIVTILNDLTICYKKNNNFVEAIKISEESIEILEKNNQNALMLAK